VNGPVVVGIDDVEHSKHALDLAAREAQLRDVPLWLVHAYQWIPTAAFGVSVGIEAEGTLRTAAEALLDEAAALVRTEHPGLAVQTVPAGGPAAQVLDEACPDASVMVIGGRGRGGFSGLMLGSVALRVLSQAHVPVMVVRGEVRTPSGHVLVGVDVEEPASGPELLEFAFGEAVLRQADVHVVHAWEDPRYLYLTVGGQYVTEQFDAQVAEREKQLDTLLAPWREKFPDVSVSRQVFASPPSRALVESSRQSDLIVLGGRVRSEGHEGLRVGALAHAILHHAHCPVLIVPEH
jgi:nucleotide-binding universal stress UspA family protein